MRRSYFSAIAKLLAFVLAVTPIMPMSIYAEDAIVYGDIDSDTSINATDALLALKHAAKIETLGEMAFVCGDVDGSAAVDAQDALWILKYAAKLIDKFPIEEGETDATPEPTETVAPTETETVAPTETETVAPTETETVAPTETETVAPTETETVAPTETETVAPTETETVAPTETTAPTETADVSSGKLKGDVVSVEVKDETYASYFSIDSSLAVGDLVFGDRDRTFVAVAESLVGSEYIVTSCDSKKTTTDIAVVTAEKDMVLSVGFDARMEETEIPAWAADFTKTELTCENDRDVVFVIYQKEVKAGESVTLGAQGRSSGVVGYIAMATAKATATEKPTVAPTEAPTETPADDANSFAISVQNANGAATVDGTKLTFADPANYKDGVLLDNPFIGKDTSNGLAISFWMTPSETVSGSLYTYRSIFTASRADGNKAIKFDLEGTRQLSTTGDTDIHKLNYWGASVEYTAGTEYFITFVITDTGLEYYVNGKSIGYTGYSKNLEVPSRAAAKELFSLDGTTLYAGGFSGVADAMQGDTRLFDNKVPAGTVMRDFMGYLGNYTAEDVATLYEAAKSGSSAPTVTVAPTETVAPTDSPAPTETVEPTEAPSGELIPFSGTIYIASDSIADGYDNRPVAGTDVVGWGNIFSNYFTDDVTVKNEANLGDSTKSYWYDYNGDGVGDGHRYKAIYQNIAKNDYVIICFGHNDGPANRNDVPVGTSSADEGSYQWYLKEKYIEPALAVGAQPILMTPVVRCFYENGVFTELDYHLKYGQAVRDLVKEYADKGIVIPLIDSQQYTYDLYQTLSATEAAKYHATNDTTHYNQAGCERICEYITSQLKTYNLGINQYIK